MTEKKPRILIAEAFEENRIALKLILKYTGFDVIETEDGQQAIEAGRREAPDLVLMDITPPVIDALQATGGIDTAERFDRMRRVGGEAEERGDGGRKGAGAGGSEYIRKAIEIEELKKLIEGCLSV